MYQYNIINIPKKIEIKKPSLFIFDHVLYLNTDTSDAVQKLRLSSPLPASSLPFPPFLKLKAHLCRTAVPLGHNQGVKMFHTVDSLGPESMSACRPCNAPSSQASG